LRRQQAADVPQTVEVPQAHGLVPLNLTDSQHGLLARVREPERREIDPSCLLAAGVIDGP